jgi:hypothetical protein
MAEQQLFYQKHRTTFNTLVPYTGNNGNMIGRSLAPESVTKLGTNYSKALQVRIALRKLLPDAARASALHFARSALGVRDVVASLSQIQKP